LRGRPRASPYHVDTPNVDLDPNRDDPQRERSRADGPYTISVIGDVRVSTTSRGLSGAKRRLLALLVAVGPDGIAADSLAAELGGSSGVVAAPALRMAVARLRDHLPHGSLPDSASGRYRLECDPDTVDAWHLDAMTSQSAPLLPPDVRLHHLVRPVPPFDGIERSALIDDVAARIERQRRALMATVLSVDAARIVGPALRWLQEHCADDPYNERLHLLAASRLAAVGDRRGALALIADCSRHLIEIGLGISAPMAELEAHLLHGQVPEPAPGRPAHRPRMRVPPRLFDQIDSPFIGSRAQIEAVLEHLDRDVGRPVIVDGASGSGKTRFLAEVAVGLADQGLAISFVTGSEAHERGSFGPFIAALPAFAERAAAILATDDSASRRSELWLAVRQAIAPAGGQGSVLIIDDAQWIDSQSLEFVAHLVGVTDSSIKVIVAGRNDPASRAGWTLLRDAADRAGALPIRIGPMDVDSIRQLVRDRHPGSGMSVAWSVATEIHARSGGRPGMALVLLRSLRDWQMPDARTIEVPANLFGSLAERVSEAAMTMGAAAAVLGDQFDVLLAAKVAGLAVTEALDAVDELVRHDLLVERTPIEFVTAHALVDAAFVQAATRSQIARMHERAAILLEADLHRRARHLLEAMPLTDPTVVAPALLTSARAYAHDELHLESSRRYRSAADVLGRPLDLDDVIAFSRSLDLAGLHTEAESVRHDGFERALADREFATAFRCSVSGLPEAEPIDGAHTIVDRLRRIPAHELDGGLEWLREQHLARQLAIIGELDEARAAADRAVGFARSSEERVASAMVRRFAVSATSPPHVRSLALEGVSTLIPRMSVTTAAEYWLLRAIDLYEAGAREAALNAHANLVALDDLPVLRRWHAEMLSAMIADDDGDGEQARALRRQAWETAVGAGLREAQNAYLIGEFTGLFLDGQAGILIDAVDSGSLDPEQNTLMRAGVCAVLAGVGRWDDAIPHAETVARSVLRSPVSQGVAALAFVAESLGRSGDVRLCAEVRAMLTLRGPSAVIVGAGAACLGPIDRYASLLALEPAAREHHARAAHAFAERSGVERWIRATRADLDALRSAS
jgi:tetratricopeptide (TPR) repeat protein